MRGGMTFRADCGKPSAPRVAPPFAPRVAPRVAPPFAPRVAPPFAPRVAPPFAPEPPPETTDGLVQIQKVLHRIQPVPYDVVGKQNNNGQILVTDTTSLKEYLKGSVVVDLCNSGYFEGIFPNEKKLSPSSKDLYLELVLVKLHDSTLVKGEVKIDSTALQTLQSQGVALVQYPTAQVIHAVTLGEPKLGETKDAYKNRLVKLYKSIFELFVSTNKDGIRFPAISGRENVQNMPRITWEAIETALSQMEKDQLEKLLTTTSGKTTDLSLCIYYRENVDKISRAKEELLGSPSSRHSVSSENSLASTIAVDESWCNFVDIVIAKQDDHVSSESVLTVTLIHEKREVGDLYDYEPNVKITEEGKLTVVDTDITENFEAGYKAIFNAVSRMGTKPKVVKIQMFGQSVPNSVVANFQALNKCFNDFATSFPQIKVVLCVSQDIFEQCKAVKENLDEKIKSYCYSEKDPFRVYPALVGGKRKVKVKVKVKPFF